MENETPETRIAMVNVSYVINGMAILAGGAQLISRMLDWEVGEQFLNLSGGITAALGIGLTLYSGLSVSESKDYPEFVALRRKVYIGMCMALISLGLHTGLN